MRQTALILLTLLLAVPSLAQNSSTQNAQRTGPAFWQKFSAAINKKDVTALRKMMPDDFFDGGGGMTPSEWLEFINKNQKNGSWRDLRRSVARGTKVSREWSKKLPTRVTKDNGYYFEFRKDKWYFAGVVGD